MYKLAIVGATGLVGKTILKILEEKNLPIYEYVLFSSKKSAGKIINFKGKDYTKVDINLKTGRHHQIRVQFANILHPLYGDIKYGNKINKVGQNLALWSYYLSFFHPTKDEYLEFTYYPIQLKNHDKIWEEC